MPGGALLVPFSRPFPKIDFGMHFGRPLAPFWRPLAPFWLPLAPFWLTFGALWLTFGALWLTFGALGSLLAILTLDFLVFGAP